MSWPSIFGTHRDDLSSNILSEEACSRQYRPLPQNPKGHRGCGGNRLQAWPGPMIYREAHTFNSYAGWGAKGKSYENGEATKREEVEVLWIMVEEVGGWIARELHTTDSELFS